MLDETHLTEQALNTNIIVDLPADIPKDNAKSPVAVAPPAPQNYVTFVSELQPNQFDKIPSPRYGFPGCRMVDNQLYTKAGRIVESAIKMAVVKCFVSQVVENAAKIYQQNLQESAPNTDDNAVHAASKIITKCL